MPAPVLGGPPLGKGPLRVATSCRSKRALIWAPLNDNPHQESR